MGRGGAASLGTARPDATIATYTRRRRRPKAQRSLSGVAPTLQGVDVGAPHEPTAPPAVSAAADKKPSRKRRRNEAGKPVPEEWVRAKRAFFALVDDEPLESDKGRATTALRFESKPTPVKPLAPPSSHSRRESSDEYEVRSVARARCRALPCAARRKGALLRGQRVAPLLALAPLAMQRLGSSGNGVRPEFWCLILSECTCLL